MLRKENIDVITSNLQSNFFVLLFRDIFNGQLKFILCQIIVFLLFIVEEINIIINLYRSIFVLTIQGSQVHSLLITVHKSGGLDSDLKDIT